MAVLCKIVQNRHLTFFTKIDIYQKMQRFNKVYILQLKMLNVV